VVGSAVMAFEEVCPERTELIHKNYRKLNNLLVDVDEWGQVLFFDGSDLNNARIVIDFR